ncbi:MAG: ABC transporter ATP-binding protein, partial [Varibaculum cambriense]|nr:ABC transporter ATP-binding protein [Varibaculum cambriense]
MNQDKEKEVLSTDNITKSFGNVHALSGVSLQIHEGESVAIMGPSGSGKSTLLHCLSGVLVPESGKVLFRGEDIAAQKDVTRSRLRLSQFGFVFQDGQLIPELPARENVALPLVLTGTLLPKALKRADQLLAQLGLSELKKRRPGDMSGGQAQRVAIARALIGNPKVVFADEPSGALDQATGYEMMEILTREVQRCGAALVLVTH